MPKDLTQVREFLRDNEQSGKPPRTKVYDDDTGIPTVSTGFNLTRGDAKDWIKWAAPNANFEAIKSGTAELTSDQALKIETRIIEEAEGILIAKLGGDTYAVLTANQQTALISLCANGGPNIIGPNLTRYIKNSQWHEAEDEIRYRSNRDRDPGLQNRREREADLFAKY